MVCINHRNQWAKLWHFCIQTCAVWYFSIIIKLLADHYMMSIHVNQWQRNVSLLILLIFFLFGCSFRIVFFSLSVKLNWEITTTNIIIKFIADLRPTLQFKSIKTTICSITQNTVSFDGFITFNWLGCNGLAHVHYVPFRQNSMNLFGSFSKWMMICSVRTHTLFDISSGIDAIWRIWPLRKPSKLREWKLKNNAKLSVNYSKLWQHH